MANRITIGALNAPAIETQNLKLVPKTLAEVHAMIEAMSADDKATLSADWLALLRGSTFANPWIHGFSIRQRIGDVVVGQAGFKGPPDVEGMVEIAYGVEPEHQGKGYATEAAQALTAWAFASDRVRVVRAHTLPPANASKRVLTKCGFQYIGEVVDPEDGLVWRWEKHGETAS